jgi:HK97 family phage major capsid protein
MDTKTVISELGNAFAEFKQSIDGRLLALEKSSNRLPSAGGSNAHESEHRRAFEAFARKGETGELSELQRKAMNVTTDGDGGYALPMAIDPTLAEVGVEVSPMRLLADRVTVSTPDYRKLINLHGGAHGWVDEDDARPETANPTLGSVTPFMGEIYANIAATQQALDDLSFDVEAFLVREIGTIFSVEEGTAFVTGNGSKKPKGLLAYATAATADDARPFGTLQHVASGIADDLPASDADTVNKLVDLIHSVRAPYRANGTFVMNSNTLARLAKLQDAQNRHYWQPSLSAGRPGQLMGYPVYADENFPDIAAGSTPIAFGDFRRAYLIVDRIGTRILRDPFTNKPHVHFYATRRVGGALIDSNAVSLLKIATS